MQCCFQCFFCRLNNAVNSHQLFTGLIATPVGRRDRGKTAEHQFRCAWNVWAQAKVVPFALFVDGRAISVFQFIVDNFNLVRIGCKVVSEFLVVQFHTLNFEISSSNFVHFFLDRFQVAFANGFHCKVIVKPTIDGWTNGWFCIRIEFHDGLRQQVCSTVAENVNALIALSKNSFNIAIISQRCGEVAFNIVDACCKTSVLLSKCIGHDFASSYACCVFVDSTIRKGNVDHRHRDASYLTLDGPIHQCDA